jgi:hypothetical protein
LIGWGLPAASTVRVGVADCAFVGRGAIKIAALNATRIAEAIRERDVRAEFGCIVRSLGRSLTRE